MALWPFAKRLETKAHPNGGAYLVNMGGGWSRSTDKRSYITEGYQQNIVVYRAVRERVLAAGAIEIELYSGDDKLDEHPVLDLLERPNPKQSWDQFLGEMTVNKLLLGECFAARVGDEPAMQLWAMNPLEMEVVPGPSGMPAGYIHNKGNKEKKFPSDPVSGESEIFFLKFYNPNDYWRGQSPLMAAAVNGDTFNAGSSWNYHMLKNGAKPPGLVRFPGEYPGSKTINRMREYFKRQFQGPQNAGEIPMISGGAEWVKLSESPKDMDFATTMKESAKYIASGLGVPIPLIDNDAATFNNIEQSKERFYTDTVIPDMEEFINAFGNWLLPQFGEGLSLRLNLDSIPALERLRRENFTRAVEGYSQGVLTLEESREMMGKPPQAEGEFKPVPTLRAGFGNEEEKAAEVLNHLAYG